MSNTTEKRDSDPAAAMSYEQAGVLETGQVLSGLLHWVNRTMEFRRGRTGDSCLDIGYYANVLDLGQGIGLAFSTDGVGTKILVAELMRRYDTIGIDCVAMNVNDLVCVGAEPLAMLDYIAVEHADPAVLADIGKGLFEGARQASISIPGGELAQMGSMIRGLSPGSGMDLVGACVGLVLRGGKMLLGQEIEAGDVIVGMESSGIHSNGLTLARQALFGAGSLHVDFRPEGWGRTLGEEILTPTRIYVQPALALIHGNPGLRALAHITSDGFLNLLRIPGSWRYRIRTLPAAPAVFSLIQERGGVSTAEMFRVFNMGIGMCAVVSPGEVDRALRTCRQHDVPACAIGVVEAADAPEVVVEPVRLRSAGREFVPLAA